MSKLKPSAVGKAAGALCNVLRDSNAGMVKLILRDKQDRAFGAIVLLEGDGVQAFLDALDREEERLGEK